MFSQNCCPFQFKSAAAGIVWPGIPEAATASLLAILTQLEQSQWLPPDQIRALQFRQLANLLDFTLEALSFYRDSWQRAGFFKPSSADLLNNWSKLPILTRGELQNSWAQLHGPNLPNGHGPGRLSRSSGSTGRPVTVRRNNIDALFWQAITLREHLWHQRDVRGKLAVIRKFDSRETAPPPAGRDMASWGAPFLHLFDSGPSALLDLGATPVAVQADWLLQQQPAYLLTYPTNATALAKHFLDNRLELPGLRGIRTLSETLSDETRDLCGKAWQVPVTDMYSAQEVGYIALQCPAHEHYHIQSENLLVEVLSPEGTPCLPGEIGRVVVTTLHGFATPLIRYEIGDYAEVGEPCPCGRGLPVLNRIMGRSRNMLTLPSGDRLWPVVRPSRYMDVAPVLQMQMIQHQPGRIEVRMVVSRMAGQAEEAALKAAICDSLGHPFQLDLVYVDHLARSPGGKFEEFISHVG